MKKAILFDFDGVLVESISHHMAAWKPVCIEAGFKPHEQTVRLTEGSKAWQICLAMAKYRGKQFSEKKAKELAEEKNVIFRSANEAKIFKEIPDIITTAKKNKLKCAVVTGSSIKNVKTILGNELLEFFDYFIVDENSPKGKPFPDPYLAAAKHLQVPPHECLVIENAPLGIQSAKTAGMFCVALQTTLSKEQLSQADVIYKDHSELLENMTNLIEN